MSISQVLDALGTARRAIEEAEEDVGRESDHSRLTCVLLDLGIEFTEQRAVECNMAPSDGVHPALLSHDGYRLVHKVCLAGSREDYYFDPQTCEYLGSHSPDWGTWTPRSVNRG